MIAFGLEWDTLALQKIIIENLKKLGWDNLDNITMGFSDEQQSAFIILTHKGENTIQIILENEEKQIQIRGGKDPKYLPEGKRVPKYKETFSSDKINEASKFFEKVLEDLS